MTIKEVLDYVKETVDEIRESFSKFYINEFCHLRSRVDLIFWFLLTTAVTTIGTLIAVIILLIRSR